MKLIKGPYRNWFMIAVMLAVAARLFVFFFSIYYPISDEKGRRVSPLVVSSSIDIVNYNKIALVYFGNSSNTIVDVISDYFQDPHRKKSNFKLPAPVFPLLLFTLDYKEGNTLPTSIFYLIMSISLCVAWLKWFDGRGVPGMWLVIFAIVPNPIWYMLAASPDLLFAVIFVVFYSLYFRDNWSSLNLLLCIVFVLALLLTRPNAVSIVLFVILDTVRRRHINSKTGLLIAGGFIIVSIPMLVFFYPYFMAFVKGSQVLAYFGLAPAEYLSGIYDALPTWLDRPLSVISLFFAKLLYTVGLRPSYGDTPLYFVMLRSAIGMVLLPGLIYIVVKGDWAHRLLIAFTLLPVLAGASQERYLLFIQPILFYFGVTAYGAAWAALNNRWATVVQRGGIENRERRYRVTPPPIE